MKSDLNPQAAFTPSRRAVVGLSAGLLVAASGPASAAALRPGDLAGDLDALIGRGMKQAPFPGLVVAIQRGEEVVYRKAFGYADLENSVPVTVDTVFPIGSVTKTMTGLSIMQLVAQGRLGLDDRAGDHLANLPAPVAALRIRNLLDHTSGLVNYTDVPGFPRNSQRPFTREEMLGWFVNLPLQFEPGTRWSYTNSGLYLLGLILEKITGLTYDVYLKRNLFTPFGMVSSSMEGWETVVPHRAHGYVPGPGGLQNAPRYDPLVPFSAGAVLSTVDDMLRYRRGVFGDGPTPPEVRRLILQRDNLASGARLPYALGCLAVTDFEGHTKVSHPGDIFGFSSQYSYYPDDRITIVLLTNVQNGAIPPISLEQKIARRVLGLAQPQIVDRPLSAAEATKFTGAYTIGEIRFAVSQMTFVYKDGGLGVSFDHGGEGPLLPLRYQGGETFVSAADDEHRFRFDLSSSPPRLYMSYYGSTFEASR